MKIAIAQSNFTVGDIAGNMERIAALHRQASKQKADLLICSEMCITGYPPEDLVLRKSFRQAAMQAVSGLASLTKKGAALLCGGLWNEDGALYNAAFLFENGQVVHRQYKHHLPNYGVFDERRVFKEGIFPAPLSWRGMKLGLLICEDMWSDDVARNLSMHGAELLVSINASPFDVKKHDVRIAQAKQRVSETGLPLIYVNQIGGQDELVFDGSSFVMSADGIVQGQLDSFREDFAIVTWDAGGKRLECGAKGEARGEKRGEDELIYNALTLGLRDYVEKNRFPGVVLGLSGGIDSALTAAVAVDALGRERVHALMMPSPYTSRASLEDAAACARALDIRLDIVPISQAMLVFDELLAPLFAGGKPDVTEENIQSRLRGNILMAVSNKFNKMLLTTGNKSEMSVGYATLYGDMCGGFNVLKDVYKMEVYALARWRNRQREVIPERVLTRAPSAELKPNQTDQDSLPPYDILDAILERLIEEQMPVSEIIAAGYERETVEKVSRMLYRSEYKRRQAPPGVKITTMSFGRDRRYPLTNGWSL